MVIIRADSAHPAVAATRLRARRRPILRELAGVHWTVIVGGGVFLVICALLVLTPWITPQDPNLQNLTHRLAPPTVGHLLGTDAYGRDVLSRLMVGGRFSVTIAAMTVVLSSTVGTVVGILSGRLGGFVDEITMRSADVLLAFPDILLALVLIVILGPGPRTVVIAMTLVGWTAFARLARAMTLEINTRGYIEAAKALGCSQRFIVFRHVLPNALNPVLSLALSRFAYQLITVGSLSYLGLGVQPPASDWGSMLSDGQPYLQQDPLLVAAPGLAVFITALSLTMAGQGLNHGRLRLQAGSAAMEQIGMAGERLDVSESRRAESR
jgi:ABC-type dipeptide/oligopeptide/nickel transport system permease subunit